MEYMICPYPKPKLSEDQKKRFNTRLSKTRVVIEHAFGHLKLMFPCLKGLRNKDVGKAVDLVHTAFIIHNFIRAEDNRSNEGSETESSKAMCEEGGNEEGGNEEGGNEEDSENEEEKVESKKRGELKRDVLCYHT
jgi:DDE superfamily endonuclease